MHSTESKLIVYNLLFFISTERYSACDSCISGRPHAIIPSWIVVNSAMKVVSRIMYKLQGPSRVSIVHLDMQGSVCHNVRVAHQCSLFYFNS